MAHSEHDHLEALARANASVAAAAEDAASDYLRPQYHLTTPAYWINDPNGPVYYRGRYHMFFQHNPYGSEWGNMSWGHAVSEDLVHWEHLPIALAPNPDSYDSDGVFSGCCVVEDDIARIFYTGVWPEVQCVAESDDELLRTWQKSDRNPVIRERPREDLEGFRDPYLWRQGNEWRMAIGSGIKEEGGTVLLYGSNNLYDWEYLHPLTTGFGWNWECPNFFALDDTHVLLVSPHDEVVYTTGAYRDDRFEQGTWRKVDLGGKDNFYAPNTLTEADGRVLMWGWITGGGSEGAPWNGVLTLPREVGLHPTGELSWSPARELNALRGKERRFVSGPLRPGQPMRLDGIDTDSCELLIGATVGAERAITIRIADDLDSEIHIDLGYDRRDASVFFDTTRDTLEIGKDEEVTFRIFLDRSVAECYVNDRRCITRRIRPTSRGSLGVSIAAPGGEIGLSDCRCWDIGSIW